MAQISQTVPSSPRQKKIKLWLPLTFVVISGAILIALIFAVVIYQMMHIDRIYPGVSVMGIDVGGMTPHEAMAAVNTEVPAYLSQSVTIEAGGESWTFTGQALGMRMDVGVLTNKAYAVGREGNFVADLATQLSLYSEPRDIEPLLWYDTGPGNQVLQELASQLYREPRDAELIIHPTAEIEVIPAQRGRQLHIEATRSLVETALFSNNPEPVQAVVQEILPGLTEVDTARQQAEDLLSGPVLFRVETEAEMRQWKLEPQAMVKLLEVVEKRDTNGQPHLVIELNPDDFTPYFEQIAEAVQQEPVDAKIQFDVEAAEVVTVEPSQAGYALDMEGAHQMLADLLDHPGRPIRLPLTVTPAAVSSDDLAALGIEELVSESTSYFKGSSEGRMHNIALAASKFNGVVIPPGEIFSFNEHLGEVTTKAGYDESLIIYGNRTTVGIGGGVCQVSTTVFRTAFFGGFELVERWAHGYRVSWYETNSGPGLDATIYTPDVDFKFRNDTEHHLLIQTETDLEAGTLTFRFYGTPTDREVIVGEPVTSNPTKPPAPLYEEDPSLPPGTIKQVDWEIDGLEVSVSRVVKAADEVLHEDEIVSRYRPWRAVYKVGPGAAVPQAATSAVPRR